MTMPQPTAVVIFVNPSLSTVFHLLLPSSPADSAGEIFFPLSFGSMAGKGSETCMQDVEHLLSLASVKDLVAKNEPLKLAVDAVMAAKDEILAQEWLEMLGITRDTVREGTNRINVYVFAYMTWLRVASLPGCTVWHSWRLCHADVRRHLCVRVNARFHFGLPPILTDACAEKGRPLQGLAGSGRVVTSCVMGELHAQPGGRLHAVQRRMRWFG